MADKTKYAGQNSSDVKKQPFKVKLQSKGVGQRKMKGEGKGLSHLGH